MIEDGGSCFDMVKRVRNWKFLNYLYIVDGWILIFKYGKLR